jgi:hypothetical protein
VSTSRSIEIREAKGSHRSDYSDFPVMLKRNTDTLGAIALFEMGKDNRTFNPDRDWYVDLGRWR